MIYGTSSDAKEPTIIDGSTQARLSCLLEGLSPAQRDLARVETIAALHLSENDTVPVFEEATQNISRLMAMPICILSIMDADTQRFKSVVGLSSLGLMNQLAAERSLPRAESFCTQVIDSGKTFVLPDATDHPAFSRSLLVQQYGIQSYVGVPLITTEGCCIGTLAVMDLLPHEFTQQEVALLELSARWSMSEFERQQALKAKNANVLTQHPSTAGPEASLASRISQVRFDLILQLTQDLRNPLTSVTGMASMLSREIYGPLSEKQQEYAKIVLSSAQQLLAMVNEIIEVGNLKEGSYRLTIATADIEMIGKQALSELANIAKQQDLKLKLTIEPGAHLLIFDKRVVKQLIYHLVFSTIKMSTAGSTIRLHISRKDESISIALWVSNPWLGEDLPQAIIAWDRDHTAQENTQAIASPMDAMADSMATGRSQPALSSSQNLVSAQAVPAKTDAQKSEAFEALATAQKVDASRQELGLLLSRHLTQMHGGKSRVQGSGASGYRYIITLPILPLS